MLHDGTTISKYLISTLSDSYLGHRDFSCYEVFTKQPDKAWIPYRTRLRSKWSEHCFI